MNQSSMNTGAIALMGNNPLAATQNNLASMGALVGLNNAMNNFPGRKLPVYTVSSDKVNSGAGMQVQQSLNALMNLTSVAQNQMQLTPGIVLDNFRGINNTFKYLQEFNNDVEYYLNRNTEDINQISGGIEALDQIKADRQETVMLGIATQNTFRKVLNVQENANRINNKVEQVVDQYDNLKKKVIGLQRNLIDLQKSTDLNTSNIIKLSDFLTKKSAELPKVGTTAAKTNTQEINTMIEAAFKKKLIPINDSLATVDKAINKLFTQADQRMSKVNQEFAEIRKELLNSNEGEQNLADSRYSVYSVFRKTQNQISEAKTELSNQINRHVDKKLEEFNRNFNSLTQRFNVKLNQVELSLLNKVKKDLSSATQLFRKKEKKEVQNPNFNFQIGNIKSEMTNFKHNFEKTKVQINQMSKKLSEISNNSKLAIDKLILEQKDLDSRISSDIQAVSDQLIKNEEHVNIFSDQVQKLMEQGLQKEKSFFKRQDELEELIKEIDLKVVIDTSSQMRGESNGRNDGVYAKYSAADIIQVDKIIGPGRRNNGARINVKGFAFCLTQGYKTIKLMENQYYIQTARKCALIIGSGDLDLTIPIKLMDDLLGDMVYMKVSSQGKLSLSYTNMKEVSQNKFVSHQWKLKSVIVGKFSNFKVQNLRKADRNVKHSIPLVRPEFQMTWDKLNLSDKLKLVRDSTRIWKFNQFGIEVIPGDVQRVPINDQQLVSNLLARNGAIKRRCLSHVDCISKSMDYCSKCIAQAGKFLGMIGVSSFKNQIAQNLFGRKLLLNIEKNKILYDPVEVELEYQLAPAMKAWFSNKNQRKWEPESTILLNIDDILKACGQIPKGIAQQIDIRNPIYAEMVNQSKKMLLFTISKYIISKVLKDPKSENAGLRFNGILIKRNVFFYYLGELKKLFNKQDIQRYAYKTEDYSQIEKRIFTQANPNWYNQIPYIVPDWKMFQKKYNIKDKDLKDVKMNWNQINWKNFKKWSSISRDKKLQRSSVQEIKEAVSVSSLKNNTIPSKADLISKLRSQKKEPAPSKQKDKVSERSNQRSKNSKKFRERESPKFREKNEKRRNFESKERSRR